MCKASCTTYLLTSDLRPMILVIGILCPLSLLCCCLLSASSSPQALSAWPWASLSRVGPLEEAVDWISVIFGQYHNFQVIHKKVLEQTTSNVVNNISRGKGYTLALRQKNVAFGLFWCTVGGTFAPPGFY